MSEASLKPRKVFDVRVVGALIAAGIVAFGLFLVLIAYAGDMRGAGGDGRAHALSNSAVGFKGVVRLIELSGGKSRMLRDPVDLDTEDLVVVALEPRIDDEALKTFLAARGPRLTLLVLPKWQVGLDPLRQDWVRAVGQIDPGQYKDLLAEIGQPKVALRRPGAAEAVGRDFLDGVRAPLPSIVQTISGRNLKPLLVTTRGDALVAQVGEGSLYVLAEPDLLNNRAMGKPATARAALGLIEALNSTDAATVAFDLTLNGFVRRANALKLAFEPPFLALTLALVVAALLAGLHGAFRFGPEAHEARAIALGKEALVENSSALFRIARREHRLKRHTTFAHLGHRRQLRFKLDRSPPHDQRRRGLGHQGFRAGLGPVPA